MLDNISDFLCKAIHIFKKENTSEQWKLEWLSSLSIKLPGFVVRNG